MTGGPDADIAACAGIVRRGDPDRFLSVMAAPVAARAVLFPIYAFNVEVARAPWASSEPMIAEMRLQWWRDALDEIASGKTVRRHEVATPLARVLRPHLAEVLDHTVQARRWDVYRDRFADAATLDTHIDQTAGSLLWVAAASLGEVDEEIARCAGRALGIANWLRAVPDLSARGRFPLPDPSDEGIRALADSGLAALARARRARGTVPPAARPAFLSVWQAEAVLRQAVGDPGRVAAGTLGQSEARKRLSLMLRAATGRW